jgi:Predicted Zn-dependent protease (DUF2268)
MKIRRIILLIAFMLNAIILGWTAGQAPLPKYDGKLGTEELIKEGLAAYDKKEFAKAAQLLQEAVARGTQESVVLYVTACSLALVGEKEKAFQFLNRAIEAGRYATTRLKGEGHLNSLHDDPRWAKAIEASEKQEARFLKDHSDPRRARFITADIARFWKAYDKALAATSEERAAIFQKDYIDSGTVGLKDLARYGRLDAKILAEKIESHQNFYAAIRPLTLRIEQQQGEMIAAFHKLKEVYPAAIFPEVYFVISQLSSGGMPSDNGLIMGAEMFMRATGIPTSELTDWQKSAIAEPREIPWLVAHESIHFQQKYPPKPSLLCQCLNEGSADYLGELVSGHLITRMQETHQWANARERQLWEEFQKALEGFGFSRWLYGGSDGKGRPVDLGYWIGYKIAEAYYKNATDKLRAVQEMLVVSDCQKFLKASGYPEKFILAAPVQK